MTGIRHRNGKTRIDLAEVCHQDKHEQAEHTYDYDGAKRVIANLFSKD